MTMQKNQLHQKALKTPIAQKAQKALKTPIHFTLSAEKLIKTLEKKWGSWYHGNHIKDHTHLVYNKLFLESKSVVKTTTTLFTTKGSIVQWFCSHFVYKAKWGTDSSFIYTKISYCSTQLHFFSFFQFDAITICSIPWIGQKCDIKAAKNLKILYEAPYLSKSQFWQFSYGYWYGCQEQQKKIKKEIFVIYFNLIVASKLSYISALCRFCIMIFWVLQELCLNPVRIMYGSCNNLETNHKGFAVITLYGQCNNHVWIM